MKKLLLHTCCAPCMLPALEVLLGNTSWERVLEEPPEYEITVWPYNPNITDDEEYQRRKNAIVNVLKEAYPTISLLEDHSEQDRNHWFQYASLLKDEPERGKRCTFCYGYRLYRTFRKAQELGFDAVATTLTLSPLKNTPVINQIGRILEKRTKIHYLVSDFKKNNGMKRSKELCEKYSVYRQNFCGCVFSLRSRA
ncbi:epoxyqueuosine reductase QueH [Thermospira aquatica]|uniref:Epoxyqueuosine reductase QueH n=1 Tax=Thermospira aquatica TaxID=2828656 RepID=A0AAX3BFZ7_9SPIR|nr:epoxyqueuosine reductase QueH [Thermospira aquatica]URA11048.1 epoxyqueuosine reductase QueH [Thermospira aquatica]